MRLVKHDKWEAGRLVRYNLALCHLQEDAFRIFLKPGAGLGDKVLELVLLEFVRLLESVLEVFLLSLVLLPLEIIRTKH